MASLAQRGMDESPTSVVEPVEPPKADQKPARSLWSLSVFDYGSPPPTRPSRGATPSRSSAGTRLAADAAGRRPEPGGAAPHPTRSLLQKASGARGPSPEQQRATAWRAVAPLAAELSARGSGPVAQLPRAHPRGRVRRGPTS